MVKYEPEHPALKRRFDTLIEMFANYPSFKNVVKLEYLFKEGGIRIKMRNRKHDYTLLNDIREAWESFGPIYEADLWDQIITRRIKEPRVRAWAASIIWWSRSFGTKGKHDKRWRKFGDKYAAGFVPTVPEFLNVCSKYLTPDEIRAFKRSDTVRMVIIDDSRRRGEATKAMARWQKSLIIPALKAIGYEKEVA